MHQHVHSSPERILWTCSYFEFVTFVFLSVFVFVFSFNFVFVFEMHPHEHSLWTCTSYSVPWIPYLEQDNNFCEKAVLTKHSNKQNARNGTNVDSIFILE